jgi:predicted aldo/keto reductase-like oxidoreductase
VNEAAAAAGTVSAEIAVGALRGNGYFGARLAVATSWTVKPMNSPISTPSPARPGTASHRQSRRHFIQTTLAGAGLLMTAPLAAAAKPRAASDRVTLGRTGIRCSYLAQGTGFNGYRRSSDHTRLGQDTFTRLLRHSLDEGVNFLDLADLYGSHPFVRTALKGVDRDKYVVLTKIWPRREDWVTPSKSGQEEVDRFRKELDRDQIDICLIHCAVNDKWQEEFAGIRDGLAELKQKGVVRAVGVSCHDHGALKLAAADPWVDVIFARINHKGGQEYSCDDTVEAVTATLRRARANGKAVVGMKIFGAGKLTKPDEKDASLRYVIGNDLVDAMTIGMLSTEQVDDSIRRINQTMKV